ncbi:MAG: helix-turn-helix domain-containing protein [Rhodocyclaceae bacterium]|jgi:transcriptional regulator with XRE-family HTH domain|nr:helix-turn-helix domain-containing protein [Rhodocyclaceae bacterium]
MEKVSLGDLGGRIREERERLGLSVAKFAAGAGVSDRSQRNYEAGDRLPDASYLVAAGALGADTDFILTGEKAAWRILAESVTKECEILERVVRDLEEAILQRGLRVDPEKKAKYVVFLYRAARWGAPTHGQVIEEMLTLGSSP